MKLPGFCPSIPVFLKMQALSSEDEDKNMLKHEVRENRQSPSLDTVPPK
jgi:hypothetical protein